VVMVGARPLNAETAIANIVRLKHACDRSPETAEDIALVIDDLRAASPVSVPGAAAARILGVSHSVVARWLRQGELLPGRKPSEVDLDDLVDVAVCQSRLRLRGTERHSLATALRARLSDTARHAAKDAGVAPALVRAWLRTGVLRGRGHRTGALDIAPSERRWLIENASLVQVLEDLSRHRGVETLVLFGSVARGEDLIGSDVDLAADGPAIDDLATRRRLAVQLSERLERRVDLIPIEFLLDAPAVLAEALADGRVVGDRAGHWRALQADRESINGRAAVERSQARERHDIARAALLGEVDD